jgi:SAM-dependent methyltransferase
VTMAPAVDLLGAAMVDFAAGRRSPVWLRVGSGRRLTHDLAAYFAPVTAQERALLALVEGPVLDVGCGPARHARLLQARELTAIGLDRSLLALGLARSFGLRHRVHADACSGPAPAGRDEYRDRVGPWGRWLQAGLPTVLDLAHPAGWRLRYAATVGSDYWAALSLDAGHALGGSPAVS